MFKKLLIAGIAGSLAIGAAITAIPASAQSPVSRPGSLVERHPIIRRSITQLSRIEGDLAKADNDFHGHKEKARDLIRQAMEQLRLAMQSDRH